MGVKRNTGIRDIADMEIAETLLQWRRMRMRWLGHAPRDLFISGRR